MELPDRESGIQININAKTKASTNMQLWLITASSVSHHCVCSFVQDGMTALHLAAMHDAKDIVDFLLNYEIDVRAQEGKVCLLQC